jgi:hypothetical protein
MSPRTRDAKQHATARRRRYRTAQKHLSVGVFRFVHMTLYLNRRSFLS